MPARKIIESVYLLPLKNILLLFLTAIALVASGCGGGGGTAPSAPSAAGYGRIVAAVSLKGPGGLERAAAAATGTVNIDIAITGYYSDNNASFEPVTTHIEVDASAGSARASVLDVPVGYNHLITVVAKYSSGGSETVKALIPEVLEGKETSATVDSRTTAIANAAMALASQSGKKLSQLSAAEIAKISSAVDGLYNLGTDYANISPEDVLSYETDVATINAIVITPSAASLSVGESQAFSATAKNIFGTAIATDITWSVTGGIGTISADGVLTATTAGSGSVSATAAGVTGSVQVTVLENPIVLISITPTAVELEVGQTQQFAATGIDSAGAEVAVTPTWSATGNAGTIDADGLFVTGSAAGSGTIVAIVGGITTSANVTVIEAPLATLTLTPDPATVLSGTTLQFSAVGKDANGNTVTTTPTWTVSGGVGTIDSSGLFTAGSTGAGIVSATDGSVTATVNVTVSAGAVISITVSPSTASVASGSSQQFTVSAMDANGNAVTVSPTWTVSGGVGAIDGNGLFTGATAGSGSVVATVGSITGSSTVTVSTGPLATITVSPTTASVVSGAAQTFTSTGADAAGNSVTITPTWSVTGSVGTINSTTGAFTATTAGSGSVVATSGSITGSAAVTVTAGALAGISISPASTTVTVGGSQQFTISGTDANGNAVTVSPTWSVTGGIGTISTTGLFTPGTSAAAGTVVATVDTFTAIADVTVAEAPLASLTISPDPANVLSGTSLQFTVTGQDANGNAVTISPAWTVSSSIGTIDSSGLFSAITAGAGTVTVTDGSISATANITVSAGTVSSITVSPSTANVVSGSTQQFTITAIDSNGNAVNVTPTWTVTGGVGTIGGNGFFTGGVAGSGTVAATVGAVSGSAAVSVTAGPLATITVSPASATVVSGAAQTFTATGADAAGNSVSVSPTWSVTGSVGTINATTGAFTAVLAGSGSVVATDGSISGSASVTVTAGALASITVSPGSATVSLGNTQTFTAAGADAAGNSVSVSPIWSVSGVGSMNSATGVYTASQKGSAVITATDGAVSGSANATVPNSAPTANAGSDLTGNTGVSITLNGTASSDPDSDGLTYSWTQSSGSVVTLSSATASQPSFMPIFADVYVFDLTVNDGSVDSTADSVSVTISMSTAPSITSVSPNTGTTDVANTITITGANFLTGATVDIGGTAATSVTVVNSTTITADVPAGIAAGTKIITVTNPDAQSAAIPLGFIALNAVGVTHSGTISAAQTWAAADSPHIVTSDVTVAGSSGLTLTIEAGAVVQFNPGTALIIGSGSYGSLVANGSAATIIFTSSSATPAAGDWKGITFSTYAQSATSLTNVVVEYAGNTTGAAINVNVGNVLKMADSVIQNTAGTGVVFADAAYPATYTGNTITGSTGYPLEIYGDYVRFLPTGNSYAGNGVDAIKVMGDTVGVSGTWNNPGVPYELQGDITVSGSSGLALTIAPGSVLAFAPGTAMNIGISSYASLIANGSTGAITFTSAAGSPSAGDWKGITFGAYTQTASMLDNVVVEYGGYITGSNMTLSVNVVSITNSTFRNSSGTGISFIDGGGGENAFTGNAITGNALHAIYIYGNYVNSLLDANTISGNGEDVIKVETDAVTTAGTWPNNSVPYQVQGLLTFSASNTIASNVSAEFLGDLNVAGGTGTKLTINGGATLMFATATGIIVGNGNYGALTTDGTGLPITFTSNATTPAPGDWKGISFYNYVQSGTLLDNVIVEYAGQTTGAGVNFVSTAVPSIQNSVIRYNNGMGAKFADGTYPSSFTNNTLSGNTEYPVEIYANFARFLPSGNTYSTNGANAIKVLSDTIANTGTWADSGVPFEIQGDINIGGSTGTKLTIGPGSTLEFLPGAGFTIGDTNYGALYADGTAGAITFTSVNATPAPGDWKGISFGQYTQSTTLLDGVVVEYAGNTSGAGVTFANTGVPQIRNSVISNNTGVGALFQDGSYPSAFTGNTLTANTTYPLEIFADYLRFLPAGNFYTGNGTDAIKVNSDAIATSGTWYDSGVPFEMQGNIIVSGNSGLALTIDAGAELQFLSNSGLQVGVSSYGSLNANGVMFTGAVASPGYWQGITFGQYNQSSTLIGITAQYGGGNTFGNIYLNNSGSTVSISGSAINFSSAYGIYQNAGSTYSAGEEASCTFTGNAAGTVFR